MEQQIRDLQQNQADQDGVQQAMHYLRKSGLIKYTGDNCFETVTSVEEAQAIKQQLEEDERMAQQMQQEMSQTPGYQPDAERQRSSLMLEENELSQQMTNNI